jgi:hypothetical protein
LATTPQMRESPLGVLWHRCARCLLWTDPRWH